MKDERPRLPFDRAVLLLTLLSGGPALLVALVLLWRSDAGAAARWTLSTLMVLVWAGLAFEVQGRVVRPLQTLANVLEALRAGDTTMRARGARPGDALGEVLLEANALGDAMREKTLGALEAGALLRAVMEQIDVAIFTFDDGGSLRLVNPAGERLLGRPVERLLGRRAEALGIDSWLSAPVPCRLEDPFPGSGGPFELRRTTFRQGGLPHHLVVLTDLRRALREEERKAWQRLIRVLSHEINNSLAPIQSIAEGQRKLLDRDPRPADWEDDLRDGLAVIARRSEALGRFMAAYARLARLPPPSPGKVDVRAWVLRVAALEKRLDVRVDEGPAMVVPGDEDQLEQLLINLVRNAADAALSVGGGVRVRWRAAGARVEIAVEDEGPGLPASGNLFVPFFTTKPQGSGIGLILSRQIAEAHGGLLRLENRTDTRGCAALLALPTGEGPPALQDPRPR
ncbi:sensor histidine kinase [Polyangium aurulentum]|uniref:sensor histidine kinase n=1 Tax=Polyangium aurulentum TaxID=2567896 RepID=UPI0010ADEEFD|nr:ATP-binding protein [Polyangium aurulentum]UQA57149.1 PAS domain-containing protein [Polyangium aurulentum]